MRSTDARDCGKLEQNANIQPVFTPAAAVCRATARGQGMAELWMDASRRRRRIAASPLSCGDRRERPRHDGDGARGAGSGGGCGWPTSRWCMARGPGAHGFYEGLIRLLDASGRVIPARDFMGAVETHGNRARDRLRGAGTGAGHAAARTRAAAGGQHVGAVDRLSALDRDPAARRWRPQPDGGRAADPGDHRKLGHAGAGDRDGLHGRAAAARASPSRWTISARATPPSAISRSSSSTS